MSKKYIYLLVGPSGAGKTTVANILQKTYKWRVLDSYTTRQPRFEGEPGHIFCTKDEFDALPDKVAYIEFDDHEYCATASQVDENDVYTIDPYGLVTFLKRYNGNKEVVIVNLLVSEKTAIERMLQRGDSMEKVAKRFENDINIFRNFRYKTYGHPTKTFNTNAISAETIARIINDDRERRYEHEKIHCCD